MARRRSTRGGRRGSFFGGDLFKDLLTIEVSVPLSLRVLIDSVELTREVGRGLAKLAKKNILNGKTITGDRLHGDGTPLDDTGAMVKSIRYNKSGWVGPSGGRNRVRTKVVKNKATGKKEIVKTASQGRGSISTRAGSNFGLMSILIARGIGTPRVPIAPFGDGADDLKLQKIIAELTQKELKRQEKQGKLKLVGELKRYVFASDRKRRK